MHMAASAIRLAEIDQALVLGTSTIANPIYTLSLSKLGVLSPTGSSEHFDAAADGYARAERFAAAPVKHLDLTLGDGDHVYSAVTGSAINANGKGQIFTIKSFAWPPTLAIPSCSLTCSLQLLAAGGSSNNESGESPASLLAGLLGLGVDQISDNALITSYGLDSLAGTLRNSSPFRLHC